MITEKPIGFTDALRKSKSIQPGTYLVVSYCPSQHRIASVLCDDGDTFEYPWEGSTHRVRFVLTPSRLWKIIHQTRQVFGYDETPPPCEHAPGINSGFCCGYRPKKRGQGNME